MPPEQNHFAGNSFLYNLSSVAYLAPEMIKQNGHGKAVDWYLLGVVFYEMLVGIPPYYASTKEKLFYNIEKAPLKVPKGLSPEAKDLFRCVRLLVNYIAFAKRSKEKIGIWATRC